MITVISGAAGGDRTTTLGFGGHSANFWEAALLLQLFDFTAYSNRQQKASRGGMGRKNPVFSPKFLTKNASFHPSLDKATWQPLLEQLSTRPVDLGPKSSHHEERFFEILQLSSKYLHIFLNRSPKPEKI